MIESITPRTSTTQLRDAAIREADAFELPMHWQDRRQFREGFVIAPLQYPKVAFGAEALEDGHHIAHISIADIGIFYPRLPNVTAYARRVLAAHVHNDQITNYMVPPALGEKLGFVHQQDRPAITLSVLLDQQGHSRKTKICRDILRTAHLARTGTNPPSALGNIAQLLSAVHSEKKLQQEEALDYEAQITSQFLLLARRAFGNFFIQSSIPAIYRQYKPEKESVRAWYSTFPAKYSSFYNEPIVPLSAPFMRFADYVNHGNLAAHLDQRKPYFPTDCLQVICQEYALPTEKHDMAKLPGKKEAISLAEVTNKLRNSSALEHDYAKIFFGTIQGSTLEETIALRQEAYTLLLDVEQHGAFAASAVDIALRKQLAIIETSNEQRWLVDSEGGRYPYTIYDDDNQGTLIIKSLYLLGQRAELTVHLPDIAEHVRRAMILKRGRSFLIELAEIFQIPFDEINQKNDDGSYTYTIMMPINENSRPKTVTAPTNRGAKRIAIREFIIENDLLDNPPEMPED